MLFKINKETVCVTLNIRFDFTFHKKYDIVN